MDPRDARIQTVFRAMNERMLASDKRRKAPADGRHVIVCECGEEACRARVYLSRAEYEAVRASPIRFAVLPGHEVPEAERVVEERDGYLVVEKFERLRYVAEQSDPRSTGREDGERTGSG
jgi:hypothetical protein